MNAKNKARISVVLCINADHSHSVAVWETEHSAESPCSLGYRFDGYKFNYSSQLNAWKDGWKFYEWITLSYNEVRRKEFKEHTFHNVQLLSHEWNVCLFGVRIEALPANSTSNNQPLDLGLIANSETRYWLLLLRKVVDNSTYSVRVLNIFQRIESGENIV